MSPRTCIWPSLAAMVRAASAPSPSDVKPMRAGRAPSPPRRPTMPRVGALPPAVLPFRPGMRTLTKSVVFPFVPMVFVAASRTPQSLSRVTTDSPPSPKHPRRPPGPLRQKRRSRLRPHPVIRFRMQAGAIFPHLAPERLRVAVAQPVQASTTQNLQPCGRSPSA